MRSSIKLLAALPLWLVLPAFGQEEESRLRLSAFGTLGGTWNSTNQAEFVRDESQPDGARRSLDGRVDSRLGVQLDGKLSNALQATVQVVSKHRYDGSFKPDLAWAFLGWNPVPEVKVRAGRLGIESFMNADSRDVGYSMLWVRPPVECFGLIPITRMNGMDLTGTFPMGDQATLRLKGFYGAMAGEQIPVEGYPRLNLGGDRILGAIAEVQGGAWRGRLAYARFKIRHGFAPPISDIPGYLDTFSVLLGDPQLRETAAKADFEGGTLQWYSLGLGYENGPFQGQAMINHLGSDRLSIPASWAGYISAGYRVRSVVPYVLWSRICSREEQPYLGNLPNAMLPMAAELTQAVQQLATANVITQSSLSVGCRWDFRANADLKLQVDRIEAKRPGSLWHIKQAGWSGRATVVTATVDFVF